MKTWSEFQEKIWDDFSKDEGMGICTLLECVDKLKKLCELLILNVEERLLDNKENKDVIGELNTFLEKLKDVSKAYYSGNIKEAVENMGKLLFDNDGSFFYPLTKRL